MHPDTQRELDDFAENLRTTGHPNPDDAIARYREDLERRDRGELGTMRCRYFAPGVYLVQQCPEDAIPGRMFCQKHDDH